MLLIVIVLEMASAAGGSVQDISYTTNFPLVENPIVEGGRWIDGKTAGLDWASVRTSAGLAYGTDSGAGAYRDSTALLKGSWPADQMVQATVHTTNQQRGQVYEEVEIRLRSALSAHSNTGYEVNFRCTHDGSQYVEIVRWNGPLGKFTYLKKAVGPGLRDGDVVKAIIVGRVITAYINGAQVSQATDGTYTSGNPGIGFYLQGAAGLNADFGFKSLTASGPVH